MRFCEFVVFYYFKPLFSCQASKLVVVLELRNYHNIVFVILTKTVKEYFSKYEAAAIKLGRRRGESLSYYSLVFR